MLASPAITAAAQPDTTQLLRQAGAGDRQAHDRLFARVYDDLRAVAHRRLRAGLRRGQAGETLGTTALVHEAYLRLADGPYAGYADRAHFYAMAARAMRFVLVDYARERTAAKRGGAAVDVPLDAVGDALQVAADDRADDVLALAAALERLGAVSPRLRDVVDLRFFAGLTFDEVAEVTGTSVATVKRDWTRARAWLYQSMHDDDDASPA